MFLSTLSHWRGVLRCLDSWAELRRRARIVDSNAIAARLQGPVLGVSLDALSLEAAEATRDACEKSGFESSGRREGVVDRVPVQSDRPRPLPRRRRGVVYGTGPVFAEGYQRNAVEVHSLVVLQR